MRLRELALARPRYGYRRLTILLRREGWHVNAKRIYRLYREEGLAVRVKRRKKLASHARVRPPAAARVNERWSMNFVADSLSDGQRIRVLTIIDSFTRECLALKVARSLPSQSVTEALEGVIEQRGAPRTIQVDNGTEFTSNQPLRRMSLLPRDRCGLHPSREACRQCAHRVVQRSSSGRVLELQVVREP